MISVDGGPAVIVPPHLFPLVSVVRASDELSRQDSVAIQTLVTERDIVLRENVLLWRRDVLRMEQLERMEGDGRQRFWTGVKWGAVGVLALLGVLALINE
jgi:hypothetical protein